MPTWYFLPAVPHKSSVQTQDSFAAPELSCMAQEPESSPVTTVFIAIAFPAAKLRMAV